METCKDCIHYEDMCKEHLIECAEHGEAERILNPCVKFKNKADFVEVVRCKNCKCCEHCYPAKAIGEETIEGWYCKIRREHMRPDDFCSYGERKDAE